MQKDKVFTRILLKKMFLDRPIRQAFESLDMSRILISEKILDKKQS